MNYFKTVGCVAVSIFFLAACDSPNNGTATSTETTVMGTDTVEAETTYDVNKKVVEKVDTVGATTEYDVEKEVVERTVKIDTTTEEYTRSKETEYTKGDYEVVEEEVEQETVSEEVEINN